MWGKAVARTMVGLLKPASAPGVEAPALSTMKADRLGGRPAEADPPAWASYSWTPAGPQPLERPRGAAVAGLARRLIARERARARRSRPADQLGYLGGRRGPWARRRRG